MKKIISLLFVLVMLFTCTAPAYAATSFKENTTIQEDVIYDSVTLKKDVQVDIWCNVEITKMLGFYGNNILRINPDASLVGENLAFVCADDNNKIELRNGFINLSFCASMYADNFEQLLKTSYISYTRDGNHIVVGCSHSEWENGVCTRCGLHCPHNTYKNGACTACGKACENEFHNGKNICPDCGMVANTVATGSILSQGSSAIVFGIGGIVIGFIASMIVFRKRKSAPATGITEKEIKDEE